MENMNVIEELAAMDEKYEERLDAYEASVNKMFHDMTVEFNLKLDNIFSTLCYVDEKTGQLLRKDGE